MYWVSLSFGKAFATSWGMMMASRFERKVGSTPVGSLKFIARVYLSFASIDSSRAAVNFPRPVIAIQRLTEATTSAEVISLSLWKGMFLRRLNIQFLPSPETSYLSSKNGTGSCLSFFWKSCSNMCHEMLAVIVAVVNDGSSAGGSPMIPTFRVPPFRGSSAGLAPWADWPAGAGLVSALGVGSAGLVAGACWPHAIAREATAPAAISTTKPFSRARRDVRRSGGSDFASPRRVSRSIVVLLPCASTRGLTTDRRRARPSRGRYSSGRGGGKGRGKGEGERERGKGKGA